MEQNIGGMQFTDYLGIVMQLMIDATLLGMKAIMKVSNVTIDMDGIKQIMLIKGSRDAICSMKHQRALSYGTS